MFEGASFKSAIHMISTVIEIPVIIVLIIAVIIVIAELGSIIVEFFAVRRKRKVDALDFIDKMKGKDVDDIGQLIEESNFTKSKRKTLLELLKNNDVSKNMAEVLAVRLLSAEELRYQRITSVTDVISRIGPMFGLMATLIPLGPGLIALGQGDTKGLSESLLTAFDATVAGLAAAGVAFIISRIRKRWYEDDLITLETVMEGILEETHD